MLSTIWLAFGVILKSYEYSQLNSAKGDECLEK